MSTRRVAALTLIGAILFLSAPSSAVASVSSKSAAHVAIWLNGYGGLNQAWNNATSVFSSAQVPQLPTEQRPRPQIFPPDQPPSRAEREARVSRLQLNLPRDLVMQAGQETTFTAIALDDSGEAIQGLPVRWSASDQNVISIRPNGRVTAGNPGRTQVKVRAGNKQELVRVTVTANVSQTRSPTVSLSARLRNVQTQTTQPSTVRQASPRAHLSSGPTPLSPLGPPDLPEGDVPTLYERRNLVGSPPNFYVPSALTPPTAARSGREMPGSDNFSFRSNITNLPGRGLSVKLALVYNSAVWLKSGVTGNRLTFDVDKNWPAPGFNLGYGHLQQQSGGSYTLVDPDGTRHQLLLTSPYNQLPLEYTSTDGTFIHMIGSPGFPNVIQGDGSQTYYGAWSYNGLNVTYYPTKITDRHGNYLSISYQADAYGNQIGPRISSIFDTLGRSIVFHYDSNNNLVTITAPGYANGPARQEVRFYYETMTDFTNSAKFASSVTVNNRPSSLQVIRYIYFPGTQSGYRYDYSPYGMVRQITNLHALTVSTSAQDQTGTVNPGEQVAATTTYDYPSSTPPSGLTSAPTYTLRTDDWAGRTTGIANTTFEIGQTIKITAPDGTISESISNDSSDVIELKRTSPLGVTTVYSRTKFEWEADVNQNNRHIIRVQTTTDAYLPSAKTKTIGYTYTDYNNLDELIEYDFNTAPDTAGPILRRTKTTYVTDATFPERQAYISKGLVHLPTSVKVFAGTSITPISRREYVYDAATLSGYTHSGQDYIINYDESFDPYAPPETVCGWTLDNPDCDFGPSCPPSTHPPCCPAHWECNPVQVYNPATAKRGNLTSVTVYADAANTTGAIVASRTYDIAGNVLTETANCCQQLSYTYTWTYQFAYPEIQTRGVGSTQLTYSVISDYNTGLARTDTDENNQTTVIHYYPDSLRLYETIRPDGGTTDVIYFGDVLFADPDATHLHSAVMTIESLDSGRTIRNWEFLDGRGSVARYFTEGIAGEGLGGARDNEFDVMGRLRRVSNPYYATAGSATPTNPTGYWTQYEYDALGRAMKVTLADNNTRLTNYADTVTTFTDEAGKQGRRTVNALGRIIQVDEPNSAGTLNQTTTFMYDALDDVISIAQGEQHRYFKYDSLKRLLFDRHAEQNAPHIADDLLLTGNDHWSNRYVYNAFNLIVDSWDARGVRTHFDYDNLNRLQQLTYSGETSGQTPQITYVYGQGEPNDYNRGLLKSVTTAVTSAAPQTVQTYSYSLMGDVVHQKLSIGSAEYNVSYSYNLGGELTSETYPSGRTIAATYDAAARLTSLSDNLLQPQPYFYLSNAHYEANGNLRDEQWGNGSTRSFTYNPRLQPTQIRLAAGSSELQRFDYQYGAVDVNTGTVDPGKNTSQIATVDNYIGGVRQWQQRFAYDQVGRLSTARELTPDAQSTQAWRVDYTYDAYGNRYQATGQGGIPVAWEEVDRSSNRLISTDPTHPDPADPLHYLVVYDAVGNLVIDRKFRGLQYDYDAHGFVRRIDATTTYATAVYDGLGQRVQTFDSGGTRHTIYDVFGQAIADYRMPPGSNTMQWERDYVYHGHILLSQVEAGGGPNSGVRYVLTDHQGSARAVCNGSGQVIARHDYKPFGEELGVGTGWRTGPQGFGSTLTTRWRYATTERDDVFGLDHASFRKYEQRGGRWTSPDPYSGSMSLQDPQSFNRYTYVENDPVNLYDPSGLQYVPVLVKNCVRKRGEWTCSIYLAYVWFSTPGGYVGEPPQPPDDKIHGPIPKCGSFWAMTEVDGQPITKEEFCKLTAATMMRLANSVLQRFSELVPGSDSYRTHADRINAERQALQDCKKNFDNQCNDNDPNLPPSFETDKVKEALRRRFPGTRNFKDAIRRGAAVPILVGAGTLAPVAAPIVGIVESIQWTLPSIPSLMWGWAW